MKKTFIIVLFITLAGSLSLMAQTKKKKAKKTVRKTTKVTPPKKVAVDTTAKIAALPPPPKDTIQAVPDSDDGFYKSLVMTKARPFPIYQPTANNIKYYHQYKRYIDLKDPRNAKFIIPGATLIDALLQGIKDGIITPYSTDVNKANPTGDEFTVPMKYSQVMDKLQPTLLVNKIDSNGNAAPSIGVKSDYNPSIILAYRLKEDVYYDKQRGKVETRIVGIAPMYAVIGTKGDTIGTNQLCWLKYTQCRIVFSKMDVSDADKNLYDVSMDDMFLQRQFNAYIEYESNAKGDWIKDYKKTPEERAAEATRIEKKLDDYKKNLWKYQTSITAVAVPDKVDKTKKTKAVKTVAPPPPDNNTGTPVKQ